MHRAQEAEENQNRDTRTRNTQAALALRLLLSSTNYDPLCVPAALHPLQTLSRLHGGRWRLIHTAQMSIALV